MSNQPNEILINERIKSFEKEFKESLDKYYLNYTIVIDFPIYKELPEEVKLALIIIDKHKAKMQLGYSEKGEIKNE